MKNKITQITNRILLMVAVLFMVLSSNAQDQKFSYADSWGKEGLSIKSNKNTSISLNYSINNFAITTNLIDGEAMQNIQLTGSFLPNNAGYPDLPGNGRFIAIPQGSTPILKVVSYRTETIQNVNVAPAFEIPLEEYNNPLVFKKNIEIYSKNEFYPAQPVIMSQPSVIRGVDVVTLGITPFQYNPVTKELLVFRDIDIEISFEGGNGHFGNDAYRSLWWDPILEDAIFNYSQLPKIDYNKNLKNAKDNEFEYLIIIPTNPEFQQWADSVKNFRMQQGILTGIVKLSDIPNSNTPAGLKAYFTNAYNNWTIKPAAILLMADYGSNTASTITSNLYVHPASYPNFASDNYYADITGDDLPDIVFARMTANNATQLQTMVTKFLNYERNPPTDTSFYDKPITALGWQDDRWFQIGSEVVGGYFRSIGKHPVRINALGSPANNTGNNVPGAGTWSTAINTSTVMNYFGPSGLNYLPSAPGTLGGFSGGTAIMVINAINAGSFILQHRDHGMYTGWGEPAFVSGNINALRNIDSNLTFVFSINCQTGAFHNASECFTEKFHRYTYNGHNSGALGLVAATEVSYSFVNDAFIWGMYDNMWPEFMPSYGTTPASRGLLPAFACAAGKHFLYQSSWPYNTSNKQITYRLFHMHGDAFQTMYSEVPQPLTVYHDNCIKPGDTTFIVNADTSSLIALTINNELIATALGTGQPITMILPDTLTTGDILVTITKQNYFRYSETVKIIDENLTASFTQVQNLLTFYFTNTSINAQSFDWDFGDGTTHSTEIHPTHTYADYGSYILTLIARGICADSLKSEEINLVIGINEKEMVKNNVFIYPNPNNGIFNITTNIDSKDDFNIKILNALSAVIYEKNNIKTKGKLLQSVDLGNCPSGIYYLLIENNGNKIIKKFSIQK